MALATHPVPSPLLSGFPLVTLSLRLKMGRFSGLWSRGPAIHCLSNAGEGHREARRGRKGRGSWGKRRPIEQRKKITFTRYLPCTRHFELPLPNVNFIVIKLVVLAPFTMRKPRSREVEHA